MSGHTPGDFYGLVAMLVEAYEDERSMPSPMGDSLIRVAREALADGSHARLIAAAPEMYEALKQFEDDWNRNWVRDETRARIRNAIAKAEGGES